MFSSSLSAGMTRSTVASRQSSAGVGRVVSAPRINPMTLSNVFGLKTKCGSCATCAFCSAAS